MTQRLPLVSAKNPHKCDEQIIPKNETAPKIPFSLELNRKSHSETGSTKATPHVSINTAFKTNPLTKITM